MRWTVETLNETVDAEVEALPEDMRARLARIARLIEEMGLEYERAACQAHRRPLMGNAAERPQRNFAGAVCDRCGSARRDRQGIREENGENAAARDRAGLVSCEIGSMMEV